MSLEYLQMRNFINNSGTVKTAERKRNEMAEYQKIAALREQAKYDREERIRRRSSYREQTMTEMLEAALNAIYMTSLVENMMFTDDTKFLAESLVGKYIAERGGARAVLDEMRGKTYLLDTICEAVEEATEDAMNGDKKKETDDNKNCRGGECNDNEPMDPPDTEEAKQDMFEKLENEDDVESAVNIISQRISSAEEEFIKKNAEDKQKIEELVNDMNDRLKAAKRDPNVSEEEEENIEQEAAYKLKRNISNIREQRPHTIFEMFVRNLSSSIVQDDSQGMKNTYYTESGQLDVSTVVDATKCLYGFLEFANTIQLEHVNEEYIKKVLEEL